MQPSDQVTSDLRRGLQACGVNVSDEEMETVAVAQVSVM